MAPSIPTPLPRQIEAVTAAMPMASIEAAPRFEWMVEFVGTTGAGV